jgi:SAM-dependent methyltransferase
MDDAGALFDPFAEVYRARMDETDDPTVSEDVAFYRALAREADGPALEVGVGTGRVYLDLLADGLDVDGIDLSTGMLRVLRETAAERGLDPSVWAADVTELAADREYGLVYAPFRAFNHLATLDAQRTALTQIRAALAPGGRFALNTFVPSFEVVAEQYGEPEAAVVEVDGETYRHVTVTELTDPVEQVATIRKELYRVDGDDETLIAEREGPLALVSKRQFELLFEAAGFDDWTVYGGFDRDSLESAAQEMVWVVER